MSRPATLNVEVRDESRDCHTSALFFPDVRVPKVDALLAKQFGVISRSQAVSAGMSSRAVDWRIQSGAWIRILPGVFHLASVRAGWQQLLVAAWLWGGEGAAVSHRAAALLHGFDGIARAPVELYVPSPRRSPRNIVVHRTRTLEPRDLVRVGCVMATSVDRTLIDLGAVARPALVEQALEGCLRVGATKIPRLRGRLEELCVPGRPGPGVLKRIVDARDPAAAPAESLLELKVLKVIEAAWLPTPVRQHEIFDGDRFVARVDLAYPEHRIAIECDGFRWHSGKEAFHVDRDRDNLLTSSLGWVVLRFTWHHATKVPQQITGQIAALLRARPVLSRSATLSGGVRDESREMVQRDD